jgi:hypothetical protein
MEADDQESNDSKNNKVKVSKDSAREEIRQISRVNSQLVPEDGNITCRNAGTCELKQLCNIM